MSKFQLLRKATLSICMLLGSFVWAQAQTGTIKGVVRDERGPLVGASVTVEGKNKGTTTNENGEYQLSIAPGSYTITISYAGYQSFSKRVQVKANETTNNDVAISSSTLGEDIVVVGTRSAGRSKLSTAVPVDVINTKELKNYAQVDAAQVLTYVAPSFQSARQTVSDGTDHIDPAGLRGLGPDQTLVLLNGKRRHNTALVNINGTVGRGSVGTDLNAIPVAAIDHIEVLRDGAAAQYGSDAIAGVINIVLKKNYKGINVGGNVGEYSTYLNYNGGQHINDGFTRQVDWYAGTRVGKGNVVFSGQALSRDRTNRSGNDNIPLIYLGNAGAFPTAPSGVDPVAYRRWLIDQDKVIATQRGYNRHNIVAGQSANDNVGAFLNGGIPLTDKTEFYFTLGASYRRGDASGFSRNPNSWAQQPVKADGSNYYPDGFLPEIHTKLDDRSAIAGIKTKFGSWDFDISNTYGSNRLRYNIENTGNASLAPTDNVQTQFDAGALKFIQNTSNLDLSRNFKNAGSFSSINFAFGGEFRYEQFQIIAGELNSYVNGGRQATIPPLPPYPDNGAVVNLGTTPAGAGAQVFPGFSPNDALKKNRNIIAGYVDAEGTMQNFLLGVAARYEKYSDFGDGLGGKVSARYDINNHIALRASANMGFRAPSLHQRYFQNTSTQFVGGLPSQSLTANNDNPIVRNDFGVESLKPEKSYSFTGGIVGRAGANFSVTVDAYYIKIKDRIVLSGAFNKSNALVAPILAAYPNVNVVQFWANAVDTRTQGVDVVVSERLKLNKGMFTISLAGNVNNNKVTSLHTNSKIDAASNNPSLTDPTKNPANDFRNILFDRQQISRIEVAQPKDKENLTLNYAVGRFDFTIRAVRFGSTQFVNSTDPKAINPTTGLYFNDVGQGTDQTFHAKVVTDIVINFRIHNGVMFGVGANNLMDIYPDRVYIDPRNDPQAVYANPVAGNNQTAGGYSAGRDASNRGRFLFNANQFGYFGRYIFAKASIDLAQFTNWWSGKKTM